MFRLHSLTFFLFLTLYFFSFSTFSHSFRFFLLFPFLPPLAEGLLHSTSLYLPVAEGDPPLSAIDLDSLASTISQAYGLPAEDSPHLLSSLLASESSLKNIPVSGVSECGEYPPGQDFFLINLLSTKFCLLTHNLISDQYLSIKSFPCTGKLIFCWNYFELTPSTFL